MLIRTGRRQEAAVNRAVRIQAGHAREIRAADAGENTTDDHLTARVHGDDVDRVVRALAGIKRFVHRAVGVEPGDVIARDGIDEREIAGQHNAAAIDHERADRRVRTRAGSEGGVHRAIHIQARDEVQAVAIDHGERAADDRLPVALQRDREHDVVRAQAGIKGHVERAVVVQARNVGAGDSLHAIKLAADDDLPEVVAALVNRHGPHGRGRSAVGDHRRHEADVQQTIRAEPENIGPRAAVEAVEITAGHDQTVHAQGERMNHAVGRRTDVHVESRVHLARRAFIVEDRDLRVGQAERGAHGVRQNHAQRPVALENRVVLNANEEGLVRLAVQEGQLPLAQEIIDVRHRALIDRGVIDGHRPGEAVGAGHRDEGVGLILADEE